MFKIKNWSSLQSYKDRNPPWIRLHKKLIDDFNFQRMSADARALLPMLWLMASEDEDPVSGMLRIGYEEITFRLRLDNKTVKSAIDEIVRGGFLERCDDEEMPLFNMIDQQVTDPLRNCYETVTQRQRQRQIQRQIQKEIDTSEDKSSSVSPKKKTGSRINGFLEKNEVDAKHCPEDLGQWAMEEFRWDVNRAVSEWEKFCDYWTAKTGANATKADWPATWRNWCRSTAEREARDNFIIQQRTKVGYQK